MGSNIQYNLRQVTLEDCNLIFEWANEKAVRENSFNSNEIKYEEHQIWFNNQISSNDCHMYIFEVNSDPVGLIRLQGMENNVYLINYSISKENRGKGYASLLLSLIKEDYEDYLLVGRVKTSNIASIKAFLRAGFIMKEECDIMIFKSTNHSTEKRGCN